MGDPTTTKRKKLLLLSVTLLLVIPPSWSLDFSGVTVVTEGGITLTQCSTNTQAETVNGVLAQTMTGVMVGSIFVRAGPGQPECFEYAYAVNGHADRGSTGNQLKIDAAIEVNSKPQINLNNNVVPRGLSGVGLSNFERFFDSVVASVTGTGNFIVFSIDPSDDSGSFYYFKEHGGYSICNAECATCNGGTNTDCLTCRSDAQKGADIDPSLAGRCVCLSGKFDSGTNSCSGTCTRTASPVSLRPKQTASLVLMILNGLLQEERTELENAAKVVVVTRPAPLVLALVEGSASPA